MSWEILIIILNIQFFVIGCERDDSRQPRYNCHASKRFLNRKRQFVKQNPNDRKNTFPRTDPIKASWWGWLNANLDKTAKMTL